MRGSGATLARRRALRRLSGGITEPARGFLVRLLVGELRQGALGGVMEEAVARAAGVPIAEIRRALMLSGNLEAVAVAALERGLDGVRAFRLVLFRPLRPMLAQPAEDLHDALDRLGEAVLEYKLDGARVQIHRSDGDVRVYTRQLNEVTPAVPEVVEAVRGLPIGEAILDGEVIALGSDGTPHPFQVTMRRFGRRLDVESLRGELPLTTVLFDALRLDGEDIFDAPLRERTARLHERAAGMMVPQRVTGDLAASEAFFDESLAHGHEGLMAKAPGSAYEAGSRGYNWLKVKTAHTLDLVVLAAEWGHGRRAGWLSNLHLGARDSQTGEFVMLGKTFKGLTDETLVWQTQEFQARAISDDGHVVRLRPEVVVEIAFDDVQESPRYPGGMALRLARVKRYRPDKGPLDADTVETVRAIFEGHKPKRRRG
jgi:DNA ligase-1